jgi:hypothetical protein
MMYGIKGKVRFFCSCGKELWESLDDSTKQYLTIAEAEEEAMCADCLLANEKKAQEEEAHDEQR